MATVKESTIVPFTFEVAMSAKREDELIEEFKYGNVDAGEELVKRYEYTGEDLNRVKKGVVATLI